MLTYEIKNLFDEMKPFNYEYEEKVKIQDDIYYHIGYGLYLKEKTDKVSGSYINKEKISKYPDLEFVGFKEENSDVLLSCDENRDDCDLFSFDENSDMFDLFSCDENSEVYDLFVYSEGYTSWDIRTLNDYIMNHIEEFHIPDVLTDTMNYISNRLKEAENSLVSIREYDIMRVLGAGLVTKAATVNEESELSYRYIQTEVTKITEDTEYIMVNGKVGVRVKPYIFKFCDPLKYRPSRWYSLGDGHIYPDIYYVKQYSKNKNFAVLYDNVCDGDHPVCAVYEIVHYVAYGNYDILKEIQDMTYYKYKEYEQKIDLETGKIDDTESNNGKFKISKKEVSVFTEEDIEENAERIFKGVPWRQDWRMTCSLLFEEEVKGRRCEYCYFLDDKLVMINNHYTSDYSRQELPLRLLSYLKIQYRMINNDDIFVNSQYKYGDEYDGGHTFIKEASETERHLMGDGDYEIYRKLKKEYQW